MRSSNNLHTFLMTSNTIRLDQILKMKNSFKPVLECKKVPVSPRQYINEPQHDKTNKVACAPSEDSNQLGHPFSLFGALLFALRKLGSLATHLAHVAKTDQIRQNDSLICLR